MKTGFIVLALALYPVLLSAQQDLGSALGKGDIAAIGTHLGDKVELAIGAKEEMLAKSQVETRLREFYASHTVKGFKMMHSGNSKSEEANYNIGELTTDKGTYRVYMYFTQAGGRRVVTELRFEM